MVIIRNWLRSVFRAAQPQRSVSGVQASPAANQRSLASFRHPRKVASVGPRLPPGQLLSGSKMPLSVTMLTVLHREILYFQRLLKQKRKLLYDLASFRCLPPAPFTLSSIAWKPRPTTTTPTSSSPFVLASDAVVAVGCPPKLLLFPAPGPWPPAPVVPTPTLAGSRIQLKFRRLRKGTRAIDLPDHPCDASCKKAPKMRHKISDHRRNPFKKRSLQRDEFKLHTQEKMRHTGGALDRPREAFEAKPRPYEHVKKPWPPMNPDKRGLKPKFLSVFIRVHPWLKLFFSLSLRERIPQLSPEIPKPLSSRGLRASWVRTTHSRNMVGCGIATRVTVHDPQESPQGDRK